MSDNRTSFDHYNVCRSCGVPWGDHLGIAGTCAEVLRLRAENAELRFKLLMCENRNQILVNALDAQNQGRTAT